MSADWRGHGVGGRLFEAVQDQACGLNCRCLMLHDRIVDESFERRFYMKAGSYQRTDYVTFVKRLS